MKIPLIQLQTTTYFRVFLFAALLAAFAYVLSVSVNHHINIEKEKCVEHQKKNIKKKTLLCKIYTTNYFSNSVLFIVTFVSTFIIHGIFYVFFGYGSSSLIDK